MSTKQTPVEAGAAARIDSATNGLSVTVGDDGAWVEFTTQTGKHFCFQPAQEFCGGRGIGGDVVRDWCLEMQARRTAPKPEDSTAGAVSAAQHTPGPWRFDPIKEGTVNAATGARSEMRLAGFAITAEEPAMFGGTRIVEKGIRSEADARLIASAPKLLDRLQDVIARAHTVLAFAYRDIPEGGAIPQQLTNLEHALRFAGATVAKATGAA